jgi:hypothetical protein
MNHPTGIPETPDTPCTPDLGWQDHILPTGLLQVHINHTRIPFDALLGFAARANLKRGFLFLSKVLGKHWPVTPRQMREIHLDLAAQIPSQLPGPVLFIALAETAIGLGQGVFEAWLANSTSDHPDHPKPAALFLHSSRYRLGERPVIEFEETHSHAPRQFLHLPEPAELKHLLQQARTLVLVDDEASTGNTFVNIAHALRTQNTQLEHVHLALITDFMGPETRSKLAQRFGLPVTIGATLSGQYRFTPNPPAASANTLANTSASTLTTASGAGENSINPEKPAQRSENQTAHFASKQFGRLGINRALKLNGVQTLAAQLGTQIPAGQTVLVLGTGEFMHPAWLLAQALEQNGHTVVVQSSTRSPILCWGAAQQKLQFPDNYNEGIENYLYNVEPGQYPLVLICHETPPNAGLRQLAHMLAGRLFHFHSENEIEEISVC